MRFTLDPKTAARRISDRLKGAERRGHDRFEMGRSVTVVELTADMSPKQLWAARISDIGSGGLGLISDRAVEQGTLLMVQVPLEEGASDSKCLLVQAMWCRPAGAGNHSIGAEFRSLPSLIQPILDRKTA
jgi:hypothetical protein